MLLKGRGHDVSLPIYFSSLTFSNFIISCNVKSEIPSSHVKGFWSAPLYTNIYVKGSGSIKNRWLGKMLSLLIALAVYGFFLYFHFVFFLLSFEVSDDSMFGSSVMVLEETTVVSTTCKTCTYYSSFIKKRGRTFWKNDTHKTSHTYCSHYMQLYRVSLFVNSLAKHIFIKSILFTTF